MPYAPPGKNVMLDRLAQLAVFASIHTADPGTSGSAEVTGGTYARKAITFSAASGGTLIASINPVFDIPAVTTITHGGFWSAASGGTFYAQDELVADGEPAPETFTAAGTYTLTDAKLEIVD